MRKLVYYIATSLDGFIADKEGDVSAFPTAPETLAELFDRYPETCPQHLRGSLGVSEERKRFDTVVMGYRTHEPALAAGLTSAYPHLRQVVVTHRSLPPDPSVEAWSGSVVEQVRALKAEAGGDIWLCGGGDLAGQLVDEIDELELKMNPVVMGGGVPLFSSGPPRRWVANGAESLPGGVSLLRYLSRAD